MNIDVDNPEIIGYFAVDSGQIMIGDPCYLDEWKLWDSDKQKFEAYESRIGEYGYLGACATTMANPYGVLGDGKGIVVDTQGDGTFPIYAIMDRETNKVAQILIDFMDTLDLEAMFPEKEE